MDSELLGKLIHLMLNPGSEPTTGFVLVTLVKSGETQVAYKQLSNIKAEQVNGVLKDYLRAADQQVPTENVE